MVGGSRCSKERVVNSGDLSGKGAVRHSAGVTAAVVAQASRRKTEAGKSGTAERSRVTTGGAKGGRKANPKEAGTGEEPPSIVSRASGDKQDGEDLWQRYGAQRGVWSQGMLEALERGVKGGKWFSLIDKVYADQTLALSWEKVKSNAGACGVDGITVERFDKQAESRLLAVKEQLKRGVYQPQPTKRVWIEKPGSPEKRPLGIPTVRDRVVQNAVRMVIEPIFERVFAQQSYGFRSRRSCKDALRRVAELLKEGLAWVVDIDIKGYFDSIPHDRLMELVAEYVADGRVLGLIESFLKAGVMEGMESWEPEEGTPQGGVISPLLANIYLNPLDWLMERMGMQMVRYADDMVVLCREEETARKALEAVRSWMEEAGLSLHPEKTRVVKFSEPGSHFDFLGYRFWRSSKGGGIKKLVRPKSKKKLKEKLKRLTRRNSGKCMHAIAKQLNPILKGWYGYFKHACQDLMREIDGWIRGRLRAILRKRRGRKGRARGRDHQRWSNRYFAQLGFFSLEMAQRLEASSLRNGANRC